MTRRWTVAVLAVVGVGLALSPVIFGMFAKAPKGEAMLTAFKPYMTAPRLAGYRSDLTYLVNGAGDAESARAVLASNPETARTAAQVQPTVAAFVNERGPLDSDMGGMLRQITANLPNYRAMQALGNFSLFPWYFFVPGILLALLALVGLLLPGVWPALRWGAAVVGVALVIAPFALGLFSRAPKGASMMSTFRTVETVAHLHRLQNYFIDILPGQGTVQLQLLPGLRTAGLSQSEIDARYRALVTLDSQWVHVLNDMMPMLSVMADNIPNYDAIRSLPSFRLFPWFFVTPGLIVIALALFGSRPPGGRRARHRGALSPLTQGVT